MRYVVPLFALLLVGAAIKAQPEAAPAFYPVEDHLVPVALQAEPDYRATIEKRLLVRSEECARMIADPQHGEGESGISVYSKRSRNSAKLFYVTHVKAVRSIWYAQSSSNPHRTKEPVRVTRVDAQIPESTDFAVFRTWREMLIRTHDYDYRGMFRVPTGYSLIEFSLIEPGSKIRNGEVPISGRNSARQQQKIGSIVRLGHLLVDYCNANAAHRSEIASRIEQRANKLRAQF